MVRAWICAAWMKKESQTRSAQYQNKAARRTVIKILRIWRDAVAEGKFFAHHHNQFTTRLSRKQSRSYFLVWTYIRVRMKFLRLSILRVQVRSRRRRLKMILSGWRRYMTRQVRARRAGLRQCMWQTRKNFALWRELACLAHAKQRLRIDDRLFAKGSLENRLRLHLRATQRDLIHLVLQAWSSLPAMYGRSLARKVIKSRLQRLFLQIPDNR